MGPLGHIGDLGYVYESSKKLHVLVYETKEIEPVVQSPGHNDKQILTPEEGKKGVIDVVRVV